MRTTGLVMALVAALLRPVAARAAVDLSGEWTVRHDSPYFPEVRFTEVWHVVQSGTQLDITTPSASHVGTIDPETGAFDVPLPDTGLTPLGFYMCTDNHFFGIVSADGLHMSGEWFEEFWVSTFCNDPGERTFTGARAACGDGGLNTGEACDDGNLADGDCCAADCQTAAADGSACSDGNVCTTDQCSAGTCASVAAPNGAPCDDGDLCTDDACQAGTCTSEPVVCGPCEVCGDGGCALPIDPGCQPAQAGGKAAVSFVAASDPSRDKLTWKWKSSGPVPLASLGSPLHASDYTLCVIDHAGGTPTVQIAATAPAAGTCGTKPCWKGSSKSWDYRDKDATPDGLTALDLDSGDAAGRGKLGAKGKGADLGLPGAALTPPVIVRLVRDDAATCWESTHSAPKLNLPGRFKASSD